MKGGVALAVQLCVSRALRFHDPVGCTAQFQQIGFASVKQREPNGQRLQRDTHHAQLLKVLLGILGDLEKAFGIKPDQSLSVQDAQDFPDGGAAHAQFLGKFRLGKTLSGLQLTGKDHIADPVVEFLIG